MKKNKIVKKPRTIADLKFDWEITDTSNLTSNMSDTISKIEEMNPHLTNFRIKDGCYTFLYGAESVKFNVCETFGRQVAEFFEYTGYWIHGGPKITGKFSHFERIDDQTYRIHLK